MRAPILGVAFAERPERLARFVRASTRITHVDPRAGRAARGRAPDHRGRDVLGTAVAAAVDNEHLRPSVPLFWPALPLRNIAFLAIALAHIARRWLLLLPGRR